MAGYFRPPFERPPTNNVGFQHSAPNPVPTGAPISGNFNVRVEVASSHWQSDHMSFIK